MTTNQNCNLFLYGSLRDRRIFRSVSGFGFTLSPSKTDEKTLYAELAFLPEHRKVSPDNVYFYAVADKSARIEGFLIHDVPSDVLAEIDKYEGKRYQRTDVTVNTAEGKISAKAYLVSRESMKKYFGDRWHVNLIHELWLRRRIEKFLRKRTRPGEMTVDAEVERQADRELLATTERDLVISHYQHDAVSDYFLEHQLDRPRPSIRGLYDDPEASPYIENYLGLVIKQVLLNQLEARIHERYRFDLNHMRTSERYFNRVHATLVALRMINDNAQAVDLITRKGLALMPYRQHDLIDYIKYAIRAAKPLFDTRVIEDHLANIRGNLQPGLTPMGAEVELSNQGVAAVDPQKSIQRIPDPMYNGFKYFNDFCLDVLSWKLGGYIDDHNSNTDDRRKTGFLELAPGRLNVAGELSRPATAGPWLLNQLIQNIVLFYRVKPHSLHLSFQLRRHQVAKQKMLPLGFIKCLLVLGGGLQRKENGGMWISRLGPDEIITFQRGEELAFSRTSKRNWFVSRDDIGEKTPSQCTAHVQQYKFIRLEERANYEPLIMCLKGLQLAYNPADYLRIEQLQKNPSAQRQYVKLKAWAAQPAAIDPNTIARFLKTMHHGLMNEAHHKPAHKLHYIEWAVGAIDVQLRMFNKQVR